MAQYQTTYSGLVTLLKDYVEDDSAEFSSAVQGIISRAEERVIRDLDLNIWNASSSGSTSAGVDSLTKSFSDTHVHAVFFSAAGVHAQRRTRDFIRMYSSSTGQPLYYAEDATRIYWAPTPDATYSYTLSYVVRPTKLSSSNETNWLTTNAADALLWAALVESESFLLAPERVAEFEGKYQQMLGPLRGLWRNNMQTSYEPINPTPTPQQTR